MDLADRIRELVAPLVAEADAWLYDVALDQGVLRITVDRDGGVDIGTIGSLTREISRLLDDTDPIPGSFTLEVSSPGLERVLRTPEHFERAVGQAVNVKTRPGVEGDRRVTGTVVAADATGVTVEQAGGEVRRLDHADIERARTVFDWGPAPKPGKGKAPATPSAEKKAAKP